MENSESKPWRFTLAELITILVVILILVLILFPKVRSGGHGEASRMQCRQNLKHISLALHQYHSVYGSFPPSSISDQHNRAQHSWRVLILPFVGQDELYREYRFDEPWNGPNNRKLLKQVPAVYRCPTIERARKKSGGKPSTTTSYVTVTGPRTMFRQNEVTRIEDITDGASRTIAVIEVADSGIDWLEPRDIRLEDLVKTDNHLPAIGFSSHHRGGTHVVYCDGRVRFHLDTTSANLVKQLLTIDDGEPTEVDPKTGRRDVSE